ncbi:hypothetical protein CBM2587_A260062 [Cupriavidus taiwanensis]|uniref:Uncharacterized protein n=1 Tax=Cupriavidus taiwanensis TaxID=164546 RepID=A0A975X1Q2_9BURK|nr:hypothetical protein CBM2587_A260062 [Cupriavidus taiwanensis]
MIRRNGCCRPCSTSRATRSVPGRSTPRRATAGAATAIMPASRPARLSATTPPTGNWAIPRSSGSRTTACSAPKACPAGPWTPCAPMRIAAGRWETTRSWRSWRDMPPGACNRCRKDAPRRCKPRSQMSLKRHKIYVSPFNRFTETVRQLMCSDPV